MSKRQKPEIHVAQDGLEFDFVGADEEDFEYVSLGTVDRERSRTDEPW